MGRNSRKFNINPPHRTLPIIKRRMMIQLKTRFHPIEILKLDESESTTFLRMTAFGGYPDGNRGVLCEMGCYAFHVGCEGEVSCFC